MTLDCIDVLPNPADDKYWNIMAAMCHIQPGLVEAITYVDMQHLEKDTPLWQSKKIGNNSKEFSIWKVIRIFHFSIRRAQNRTLIKGALLDTESFRSIYDAGEHGTYVQKDNSAVSNSEKPEEGTEDLGEAERMGGIDKLLAALSTKIPCL